MHTCPSHHHQSHSVRPYQTTHNWIQVYLTNIDFRVTIFQVLSILTTTYGPIEAYLFDPPKVVLSHGSGGSHGGRGRVAFASHGSWKRAMDDKTLLVGSRSIKIQINRRPLRASDRKEQPGEGVKMLQVCMVGESGQDLFVGWEAKGPARCGYDKSTRMIQLEFPTRPRSPRTSISTEFSLLFDLFHDDHKVRADIHLRSIAWAVRSSSSRLVLRCTRPPLLSTKHRRPLAAGTDYQSMPIHHH